RMKQIEKLKVEDVKPSSRQYPYIKLLVDDKEKLHRLALEAKGLATGYQRGKDVFERFNLTIEAAERIAIIAPNGVGKSTLLRSLLKPEIGTAKWADKARVAYWPQDAADEFQADEFLAAWLRRRRRPPRPPDD